LRTLAAEGIERARVPERPVGDGRVGEVIRSGTPLFDEKRFLQKVSAGDVGEPVIIVPLRIRDRVVGVILVWELLSQKTSLADIDYELFNLLGGHAAFALQGAKLNAELHGRTPALWAAADLV
jgi:hypothetical protein